MHNEATKSLSQKGGRGVGGGGGEEKVGKNNSVIAHFTLNKSMYIYVCNIRRHGAREGHDDACI